jgi:integrase
MQTSDIHLRKNGQYWLASWTHEGREKRKSLGNRAKVSKAEALRRCRQIAREHIIHPGRAGANRAPGLKAWTDQYLAMRTDLDPATIKLQEQTIKYLHKYFGADRRLDRISRADAAGFRAWLADQDLADATVRKHIRHIKVIFGPTRGAMKLDLIPFNPFDREQSSVPETDNNWRQLEPEQIQALIDAAPSPAWRALYALCAYAGLRRSEALRLTWADIQWDRNRLTVRAKAGKRTTKQNTRDVLMESELARILLDVHDQAGDDARICPLSGNNMNTRIEVSMKDAGLRLWAKPYHTLRANRARTWKLIYPEYVVDAWLGHSLAVSRKHYLSVPEDLYDAANQQRAELVRLLSDRDLDTLKQWAEKVKARKAAAR